MATGQEVLNQALLLLDYTGRYAGGQAAMARRGLAAVNQAYCDLWHIEGRGAFVPLRTLDGVLELSERACADILPYGAAMFLAQSEGDGDSQRLYAALYNQKRAGAAGRPLRVRDTLFGWEEDDGCGTVR